MAKRLSPAYMLRPGVVQTCTVDLSLSGGYLTTAFDQNTLSVRVWGVARPSRGEP